MRRRLGFPRAKSPSRARPAGVTYTLAKLPILCRARCILVLTKIQCLRSFFGLASNTYGNSSGMGFRVTSTTLQYWYPAPRAAR